MKMIQHAEPEQEEVLVKLRFHRKYSAQLLHRLLMKHRNISFAGHECDGGRGGHIAHNDQTCHRTAARPPKIMYGDVVAGRSSSWPL